jgi:hypothetical protein
MYPARMEVRHPTRRATAVYGKLVGADSTLISYQSTVRPRRILKAPEKIARYRYS